MSADGVLQTLEKLLGEHPTVLRPYLLGRDGCRSGVAFDARIGAGRPLEDVARRELPRSAPDGERCRDGVEREKRLQRVKIDFALRESAKLRGEQEPSPIEPVRERLDAEAVACKEEVLLTGVPDR